MYSFESRVRYSEIDSERKLTLPSLLDYLQDCCTFESEKLQIGVDYLQQHEVAWVLSSWQIRIARYPRFNERIRINTWPYGFRGFYGYRNFSIEDARGEMIASANSVWVFMDTSSMCPMKITESIQKAYQDEYGEQLPGEWASRKIGLPKSGEERAPVQVARFHIDTNHHMNNAKYVLEAEEYLPEGFPVRNLRAEYKKSAVLGDILYSAVTNCGDTVTVVFSNKENQPYAVLSFSARIETSAKQTYGGNYEVR